MKIASFVSNIPTMDDTRTYEDFYKYLGDKPTELGVVSRMFPHNTAAFITESLRNIFYLDAKGSGNKYQATNSLMYQWEIGFLFPEIGLKRETPIWTILYQVII